MHEVIKKSFKEIENWLNEEIILDQSVRILKEGILKNVINSHITLAEEKIKSLNEEMEDEVIKGRTGRGAKSVRAVIRNEMRREEIDKWKQFISKLKE